MNDWKREVDEKQEQKAKRIAEELRIKQEKVLQEKLQVLQRNFQCCMCGKLPTIPYTRTYTSESGDHRYEDWSLPGDLWECSYEGKPHWACCDHYHLGFCYEHRDLVGTDYIKRRRDEIPARDDIIGVIAMTVGGILGIIIVEGICFMVGGFIGACIGLILMVVGGIASYMER